MEIRVSRRARKLRLSVGPGGKVTVTRPAWVSEAIAYQFFTSKADWLSRAVAKMKLIAPRVALPRLVYKKQRIAAKKFVASRIHEINKFYGFRFNNIYIKNQKTRWGSCSKAGNLSFNYRILSLPPDLADYLIVHELCHLQQLNHSKKFWALVSLTVPHPKASRAALRRYRLH